MKVVGLLLMLRCYSVGWMVGWLAGWLILFDNDVFHTHTNNHMKITTLKQNKLKHKKYKFKIEFKIRTDKIVSIRMFRVILALKFKLLT